MNEDVDIRVRLDSQERLILELRAKLAMAEKQVAQKQLHIVRLERRLEQYRRSPIDRIFNA